MLVVFCHHDDHIQTDESHDGEVKRFVRYYVKEESLEPVLWGERKQLLNATSKATFRYYSVICAWKENLRGCKFISKLLEVLGGSFIKKTTLDLANYFQVSHNHISLGKNHPAGKHSEHIVIALLIEILIEAAVLG